MSGREEYDTSASYRDGVTVRGDEDRYMYDREGLQCQVGLTAAANTDPLLL